MPKPEDHIAQAIKNLSFLELINQNIPDCLDWQVTVSFYAALHLVNAHVADKGMQYRKHSDITNFINPLNRISIGILPDDVYTAYQSLMSLSRRSRYLVSNQDHQLSSDKAQLTYETHLAKSIRHLETIMNYFDGKFSSKLPVIKINCPGFTFTPDIRYFLKA